MANTQAFCTSAKVELLTAYHNFGTTVTRGGTGADTFKAALYEVTAGDKDATSTVYNTTGEVVGTNYVAEGVTIGAFVAPTNDSTTAHTQPTASIVYSNVTLSTAFDAVLIFNSTNGDRAFSVHTFGSQTVTAGDFTLTMPTNDGTTGLIRVA